MWSHGWGSIRMNIEEYVNNYSEDDELEIMFAWNGKHADEFDDENMEFRRSVLEYFEDNPKAFPLALVAALYDAETEFAKEAWCVNKVVSLLAQEMLERGRAKYASTYLKGWARGMDAHIQSTRIELSQGCIQDLIGYCNGRKEDDKFPNKRQTALFAEFLQNLSSPKD